jgi:hypothetical protein
MTQTEGNSGSDRRQPQVKLTKQKASNKHTEASGKGPEAAASVDTKIPADKETTGKIMAMTNTTAYDPKTSQAKTGAPGIGDTPGMGTVSGNGATAATMAQNWPTPKESMTIKAPTAGEPLCTEGKTQEKNSLKPSTMTMRAKKSTYPIFQRGWTPSNKEKKSNSMTTADSNKSNPNNSTLPSILQCLREHKTFPARRHTK